MSLVEAESTTLDPIGSGQLKSRLSELISGVDGQLGGHARPVSVELTVSSLLVRKGNSVMVYSVDAYEMRLTAAVCGKGAPCEGHSQVPASRARPATGAATDAEW